MRVDPERERLGTVANVQGLEVALALIDVVVDVDGFEKIVGTPVLKRVRVCLGGRRIIDDGRVRRRANDVYVGPGEPIEAITAQRDVNQVY